MKKKAPKIGAKARRDAMLKRIEWRTKGAGHLSFPAVPGMADQYVAVMKNVFAAMGRPFGKGAAASCRAAIDEKINWAFERSHNATVTVDWKTDQGPTTSLTWTVTGWHQSIEEAYAEWVKLRQPPLFGKNPDARVMDLARTLGAPGEVTVLDAGAGDGRNALPLAREGFVVDALELAPALVQCLEELARETKTDVRSVLGSFYDRELKLPHERYRLIVLAEVCSHWRTQRDLRNTLLRLNELVERGGIGLFNVFLAHEGFKPNAVERNFSQIGWCPIFTREEIRHACEGLSLELIGDDSAQDYEKAHGSKDGWPPTGWFVRWTGGREVFDVSPEQSQFELRWLAFRRA